MRITRRLQQRTKLIMLIIAMTIFAVLTVGATGWLLAQNAKRGQALVQLASIRTDRADSVEQYFKVLRNELTLLSKDKTILDAMVEFEQAYNELETQPIATSWDTATIAYYEQQFLPSLELTQRKKLDAERFLPTSNAARYLQHQYIVDNPNPVGSKQLLNQVLDFGDYDDAHTTHHPFVRIFIELFGYYDLFLIDKHNRNIVYSVFKEVDFGTSLLDGPYATSGLAEAVELVLRDPQPNEIMIVDFLPYEPSSGDAAAFVATALYDEDELIGVLAIQIPINELNDVMTSNEQWQAYGLGETGKTYLVGSDHLMRSTSRYLIEDSVGYTRALRETGVDQSVLDRINNLGTSILLQEVNTTSVEKAIAGETNSHIISDFRNVSVLSAYAPLGIEGLNWAVIAEIDEGEITTLADEELQRFGLVLGGIALLMSLFGIFVANRLTRPLRHFATEMRTLAADDFNGGEANELYGGEVGQLAKFYNGLLAMLQQQRTVAKSTIAENEKLMLSVLPSSIAARVKNGESAIAEEIKHVTLMFAHLHGVPAFVQRFTNKQQAAETLNILTARLEDASHIYEVDRNPTASNRFVALCGLNHEGVESVPRILDYAFDSLKILEAFNAEFGSRLGLKIGVHTGSILAAVLDTDLFQFELWGETVEIVEELETMAAVNTILVSHEIYQHLHDQHRFEAHERVDLGEGREWRAWTAVPPLEDSEGTITDRFALALAQSGQSSNLPASLRPRNRRLINRFNQN